MIEVWGSYQVWQDEGGYHARHITTGQEHCFQTEAELTALVRAGCVCRAQP